MCTMCKQPQHSSRTWTRYHTHTHKHGPQQQVGSGRFQRLIGETLRASRREEHGCKQLISSVCEQGFCSRNSNRNARDSNCVRCSPCALEPSRTRNGERWSLRWLPIEWHRRTDGWSDRWASAARALAGQSERARSSCLGQLIRSLFLSLRFKR